MMVRYMSHPIPPRHGGTVPLPRRRIVAFAVAMLPTSMHAACSVSAQSVNFGVYDTFSRRDADSVGTIALTCDGEVAYTLSLSTGSGSYAARQLGNGGQWLFYNLYTEPARMIVWGDGSGASTTVGGIASVSTSPISVYARIPAGQNVPVGDYVDNVVISLDF